MACCASTATLTDGARRPSLRPLHLRGPEERRTAPSSMGGWGWVGVGGGVRGGGGGGEGRKRQGGLATRL